jgi:xanthine permease XanP
MLQPCRVTANIGLPLGSRNREACGNSEYYDFMKFTSPSPARLVSFLHLDSRRIFALGISLTFGLSVEISPKIYCSVPAMLQPMFSSSAALATVLVTVLSLLFRIGIGKQKVFHVTPAECSVDDLHKIMDEQGSVWGMRPEILSRAK